MELGRRARQPSVSAKRSGPIKPRRTFGGKIIRLGNTDSRSLSAKGRESMNSTVFGKFGLAGAVCALLQWTTLADPLATWHQRNSLSQTNPLNSITYAKGLFVAVG